MTVKKKVALGSLLLLTTIGVVLAVSVISNIFEGLIPHVSIPKLIQVDASAPENVSIGAPFYMDFNVTNPNDFTVYARIYINFTLNGASSINTSSMSYFWKETTFQFTSGDAFYDVSVSDNTWMFNAPSAYPGWYIKIPSGTNTYRMQFQVNVQCESISYKVWFAS